MKNGIILAKKSTWTSKLDLNYLDETSLLKRQQNEDMRIGRKLEQFADYASKADLGAVHIAGFLHNRVAQNRDGSFTHPTNLENAERKRRIVLEWGKALREPVGGRGAKADVIQHRLVLSMSKDMHRACLNAGLNPDQVLHESMTNVMEKFAEKFHPGDKISYAYGFHHDTDNLHVHIALCPRTASGNYVGFSTPRNKVANPSHHRDQIGFVRSRCAHENNRWEQIFSDPEKLAQFAERRHVNRWLVSPKHSLLDLQNALNNRDMEAQQLHFMYGSLQKLHHRMEQIKAQQRQAVMDGLAASLFRIRGVSPAIRAEKDRTRNEFRELRRQFCRLRSAYLARHHALAKRPPHHYVNPHAYRLAQQRRQQTQQSQQPPSQGVRV
jgi:hypothetical protein